MSQPGVRCAPDVVIRCRDGVIALYVQGTDLWLASLGGEEVLECRLQDNVDVAESPVERWHFKSVLAAKEALRKLGSRLEMRGPRGDLLVNLQQWRSQLEIGGKPRIATYAVDKEGPLQLDIHGLPPWLFPRPPALCASCDRVMIPLFSLSGPIDSRLGQEALVVVSQCPQAVGWPTCAGNVEVVIQRPNLESLADIYLLDDEHFCSLHLSEQSKYGALLWTAVEHVGKRKTPGRLVSTTYRTLSEAQKAIQLRSRDLTHKRRFHLVSAADYAVWHRKALGEIHTFFRPPGREPERVKLARILEPFEQSCSLDYVLRGSVRDEIDGWPCTYRIGGTPRRYRSDWSTRNSCRHCKTEMLYLFSACSEQSPYINDTNPRGRYHYYSCAECSHPFGWVEFEYE